jgi:hypothetical protein
VSVDIGSLQHPRALQLRESPGESPLLPRPAHSGRVDAANIDDIGAFLLHLFPRDALSRPKYWPGSEKNLA